MTDELRSCPFCGSEAHSMARMIVTMNGTDKLMGWVCGCNRCDTHVWGDNQFYTELVWNARPLEDALHNKLVQQLLKESTFFGALSDVRKDGDSYKLKHTKEDVSNLQALWIRFCRIMDMWEIGK